MEIALQELIQMLRYTDRTPDTPDKNIGKFVIIRTFSAGVHMGVLVDYDRQTRHCRLTDARRIWSWEGAFTLSAIALRGLKTAKISASLPDITIAEVIEIITCSIEAEQNLRDIEEYTPWSTHHEN